MISVIYDFNLIYLILINFHYIQQKILKNIAEGSKLANILHVTYQMKALDELHMNMALSQHFICATSDPFR